MEGVHHGSVVVTTPDGTVDWSVGVVALPMFPRSANKPMQAARHAAVRPRGCPPSCWRWPPRPTPAKPFHLDGVRLILHDAGLDVDALHTPPAYPIDASARDDRIRAGHRPEPITMNCSGKHAAMLATCVHNGWPTTSYLAPEHPLQVVIRAAVEQCAGESVHAIAVDGCGAPLLAISLTGLARAFGRFASAPADTPEGRIANAARTHPEYVSGTHRDEAALIRATPGLLCKGGTEGVYAAGLADGRGIAVKISDGAARARSVVLAEVLHRLGVDNETIRRQRELPVLGGGAVVGAVRATFPPTSPQPPASRGGSAARHLLKAADPVLHRWVGGEQAAEAFTGAERVGDHQVGL